MRPINRGPWPKDTDGKNKNFPDYMHARKDLITRLGPYCSYCGVKLSTAIAIEHVLPKFHNPKLRTVWSNLLLACDNCNTRKGSRRVLRKLYLWPDKDNTHRALIYGPGHRVEVNPALPNSLQRRAKRLVNMLRLDVTPDTDSASDRRWIERNNAWDIAENCLKIWKSTRSVDISDMILMLANSTGFWSVWVTVFDNEPSIKNLLIYHFNGNTATNCFNKRMELKRRPGGAV